MELRQEKRPAKAVKQGDMVYDSMTPVHEVKQSWSSGEPTHVRLVTDDGTYRHDKDEEILVSWYEPTREEQLDAVSGVLRSKCANGRAAFDTVRRELVDDIAKSGVRRAVNWSAPQIIQETIAECWDTVRRRVEKTEQSYAEATKDVALSLNHTTLQQMGSGSTSGLGRAVKQLEMEAIAKWLNDIAWTELPDLYPELAFLRDRHYTNIFTF